MITEAKYSARIKIAHIGFVQRNLSIRTVSMPNGGNEMPVDFVVWSQQVGD